MVIVIIIEVFIIRVGTHATSIRTPRFLGIPLVVIGIVRSKGPSPFQGLRKLLDIIVKADKVRTVQGSLGLTSKEGVVDDRDGTTLVAWAFSCTKEDHVSSRVPTFQRWCKGLLGHLLANLLLIHRSNLLTIVTAWPRQVSCHLSIHCIWTALDKFAKTGHCRCTISQMRATETAVC